MRRRRAVGLVLTIGSSVLSATACGSTSDGAGDTLRPLAAEVRAAAERGDPAAATAALDRLLAVTTELEGSGRLEPQRAAEVRLAAADVAAQLGVPASTTTAPPPTVTTVPPTATSAPPPAPQPTAREEDDEEDDDGNEGRGRGRDEKKDD